MPAMIYKNADVQRLSGASATQLEYWCRDGAIVPFKDAKSSGDHRLFSLTNVVEAAIARELTTNGMAPARVKIVLAQLREQVNKLAPNLRASATFIRYIEMVDAIVTITGPGPNYAAWRADVAKIERRWKRTQPQTPIDEHVLLPVLLVDRTAIGDDAET
jgi:DNA-binding transcriptional MerR regulator